MGDAWSFMHAQVHAESRDKGESCPMCGQRPDGTYPPKAELSNRELTTYVYELEKRIEVLEKEAQYLGARHGDW